MGKAMEMPQGNGLDPRAAIYAVASSFALGAATGLALFCRSTEPLSLRALGAWALWSAIWAVGVASMVFAYFPVEEWTWQTLWLALGISAISGAGGNTSAGFVLDILKAVITRKP